MTSLLAFAFGFHAFALPLLGLGGLLASKIASRGRRAAERFFIATLTLVTLVTLRTVATNDPAWLTHTLTLALMILGAVALPSISRQTLVNTQTG